MSIWFNEIFNRVKGELHLLSDQVFEKFFAGEFLDETFYYKTSVYLGPVYMEVGDPR